MAAADQEVGSALAQPVTVLAVLDGNGDPVFAQAYEGADQGLLPGRREPLFRQLCQKAATTTQLCYSNGPVVYRRLGGLVVLVAGREGENELLLSDIVSTVSEVVQRAVEGELSAAGAETHYLALCAGLTEAVDQGFYLSNEAAPVYSQGAEKGALRGALDGIKFVAKTLLS